MVFKIRLEDLLIDLKKRFNENPKKLFVIVCNGKNYFYSDKLQRELKNIGANYITNNQTLYEELINLGIPYDFIKKWNLLEANYNIELDHMIIID